MFFKIKKQQYICFHNNNNNNNNVTLFAILWQYSIYSKIKAVLKALEAPDLRILTHFKKSSKKIKQETGTKHFFFNNLYLPHMGISTRILQVYSTIRNT